MYNFVFFDLETTGLYNSNPDIVQVNEYKLPLNCETFSTLSNKGDQIGRITAYWATFYFGPFLGNYRSSPHF
jgi:DNA polymerase III epsilon subunit-like protein